jgi:cleavage and polyadenylation specificity factor subunit 4
MLLQPDEATNFRSFNRRDFNTSSTTFQYHLQLQFSPHSKPSIMAAIISKGHDATDISRQILSHQAHLYKFSFTPFLFTTYRYGLSPDRPTCKAYLQGHCPLGVECPDKHAAASSNSNFNNLVCKHWLRGLCKKGESCEFLHEFNLRKMPECNFFVRNGYCSNGGWYSVFSRT